MNSLIRNVKSIKISTLQSITRQATPSLSSLETLRCPSPDLECRSRSMPPLEKASETPFRTFSTLSSLNFSQNYSLAETKSDKAPTLKILLKFKKNITQKYMKKDITKSKKGAVRDAKREELCIKQHNDAVKKSHSSKRNFHNYKFSDKVSYNLNNSTKERDFSCLSSSKQKHDNQGPSIKDVLKLNESLNELKRKKKVEESICKNKINYFYLDTFDRADCKQCSTKNKKRMAEFYKRNSAKNDFNKSQNRSYATRSFSKNFTAQINSINEQKDKPMLVQDQNLENTSNSALTLFNLIKSQTQKNYCVEDNINIYKFEPKQKTDVYEFASEEQSTSFPQEVSTKVSSQNVNESKRLLDILQKNISNPILPRRVTSNLKFNQTALSNTTVRETIPKLSPEKIRLFHNRFKLTESKTKYNNVTNVKSQPLANHSPNKEKEVFLLHPKDDLESKINTELEAVPRVELGEQSKEKLAQTIRNMIEPVIEKEVIKYDEVKSALERMEKHLDYCLEKLGFPKETKSTSHISKYNMNWVAKKGQKKVYENLKKSKMEIEDSVKRSSTSISRNSKLGIFKESSNPQHNMRAVASNRITKNELNVPTDKKESFKKIKLQSQDKYKTQKEGPSLIKLFEREEEEIPPAQKFQYDVIDFKEKPKIDFLKDEKSLSFEKTNNNAHSENPHKSNSRIKKLSGNELNAKEYFLSKEGYTNKYEKESFKYLAPNNPDRSDCPKKKRINPCKEKLKWPKEEHPCTPRKKPKDNRDPCEGKIKPPNRAESLHNLPENKVDKESFLLEEDYTKNSKEESFSYLAPNNPDRSDCPKKKRINPCKEKLKWPKEEHPCTPQKKPEDNRDPCEGKIKPPKKAESLHNLPENKVDKESFLLEEDYTKNSKEESFSYLAPNNPDRSDCPKKKRINPCKEKLKWPKEENPCIPRKKPKDNRDPCEGKIKPPKRAESLHNLPEKKVDKESFLLEEDYTKNSKEESFSHLASNNPDRSDCYESKRIRHNSFSFKETDDTKIKNEVMQHVQLKGDSKSTLNPISIKRTNSNCSNTLSSKSEILKSSSTQKPNLLVNEKENPKIGEKSESMPPCQASTTISKTVSDFCDGGKKAAPIVITLARSQPDFYAFGSPGSGIGLMGSSGSSGGGKKGPYDIQKASLFGWGKKKNDKKDNQNDSKNDTKNKKYPWANKNSDCHKRNRKTEVKKTKSDSCVDRNKKDEEIADPYNCVKRKKSQKDCKKKDPCETKKTDPCATQNKDPCATQKKDPCATQKKDPCATQKKDPCAPKKKDSCETKKKDPCETKKKDSCDSKNKEKKDPCKDLNQSISGVKCEKKESKPKQDPCKQKDPCATQKKDPCATQKKDPCATQKKDPCATQKKDPCETKNRGSGSKDPYSCVKGKKSKNKVNCETKEKKDPCKDLKKSISGVKCEKNESKPKQDPCKQKDPCATQNKDPCKQKDPCKTQNSIDSLGEKAKKIIENKKDSCKQSNSKRDCQPSNKTDDKKGSSSCLEKFVKKKEDPCKAHKTSCPKKEDDFCNSLCKSSTAETKAKPDCSKNKSGSAFRTPAEIVDDSFSRSSACKKVESDKNKSKNKYPWNSDCGERSKNKNCETQKKDVCETKKQDEDICKAKSSCDVQKTKQTQKCETKKQDEEICKAKSSCDVQKTSDSCKKTSDGSNKKREEVNRHLKECAERTKKTDGGEGKNPKKKCKDDNISSKPPMVCCSKIGLPIREPSSTEPPRRKMSNSFPWNVDEVNISEPQTNKTPSKDKFQNEVPSKQSILQNNLKENKRSNTIVTQDERRKRAEKLRNRLDLVYAELDQKIKLDSNQNTQPQQATAKLTSQEPSSVDKNKSFDIPKDKSEFNKEYSDQLKLSTSPDQVPLQSKVNAAETISQALSNKSLLETVDQKEELYYDAKQVIVQSEYEVLSFIKTNIDLIKDEIYTLKVLVPENPITELDFTDPFDSIKELNSENLKPSNESSKALFTDTKSTKLQSLEQDENINNISFTFTDYLHPKLELTDMMVKESFIEFMNEVTYQLFTNQNFKKTDLAKKLFEVYEKSQHHLSENKNIIEDNQNINDVSKQLCEVLFEAYQKPSYNLTKSDFNTFQFYNETNKKLNNINESVNKTDNKTSKKDISESSLGLDNKAKKKYSTVPSPTKGNCEKNIFEPKTEFKTPVSALKATTVPKPLITESSQSLDNKVRKFDSTVPSSKNKIFEVKYKVETQITESSPRLDVKANKNTVPSFNEKNCANAMKFDCSEAEKYIFKTNTEFKTPAEKADDLKTAFVPKSSIAESSQSLDDKTKKIEYTVLSASEDISAKAIKFVNFEAKEDIFEPKTEFKTPAEIFDASKTTFVHELPPTKSSQSLDNKAKKNDSTVSSSNDENCGKAINFDCSEAKKDMFKTKDKFKTPAKIVGSLKSTFVPHLPYKLPAKDSLKIPTSHKEAKQQEKIEEGNLCTNIQSSNFIKDKLQKEVEDVNMNYDRRKTDEFLNKIVSKTDSPPVTLNISITKVFNQWPKADNDIKPIIKNKKDIVKTTLKTKLKPNPFQIKKNLVIALEKKDKLSKHARIVLNKTSEEDINVEANYVKTPIQSVPGFSEKNRKILPSQEHNILGQSKLNIHSSKVGHKHFSAMHGGHSEVEESMKKINECMKNRQNNNSEVWSEKIVVTQNEVNSESVGFKKCDNVDVVNQEFLTCNPNVEENAKRSNISELCNKIRKKKNVSKNGNNHELKINSFVRPYSTFKINRFKKLSLKYRSDRCKSTKSEKSTIKRVKPYQVGNSRELIEHLKNQAKNISKSDLCKMQKYDINENKMMKGAKTCVTRKKQYPTHEEKKRDICKHAKTNIVVSKAEAKIKEVVKDKKEDERKSNCTVKTKTKEVLLHKKEVSTTCATGEKKYPTHEEKKRDICKHANDNIIVSAKSTAEIKRQESNCIINNKVKEELKHKKGDAKICATGEKKIKDINDNIIACAKSSTEIKRRETVEDKTRDDSKSNCQIKEQLKHKKEDTTCASSEKKCPTREEKSRDVCKHVNENIIACPKSKTDIKGKRVLEDKKEEEIRSNCIIKNKFKEEVKHMKKDSKICATGEKKSSTKEESRKDVCKNAAKEPECLKSKYPSHKEKKEAICRFHQKKEIQKSVEPLGLCLRENLRVDKKISCLEGKKRIDFYEDQANSKNAKTEDCNKNSVQADAMNLGTQIERKIDPPLLKGRDLSVLTSCMKKSSSSDELELMEKRRNLKAKDQSVLKQCALMAKELSNITETIEDISKTEGLSKADGEKLVCKAMRFGKGEKLICTQDLLSDSCQNNSKTSIYEDADDGVIQVLKCQIEKDESGNEKLVCREIGIPPEINSEEDLIDYMQNEDSKGSLKKVTSKKMVCRETLPTKDIDNSKKEMICEILKVENIKKVEPRK